MKVVLKQNMPHLGEVGSVVKVRDGYARNFLIPQGIAEVYTKSAQKTIDNLLDMQKHKVNRKEKQYRELLDKVKGRTFTMKAKAGDSGKMFGRINPQSVAEMLAAEGVEIDKKFIVMKAIINTIGEHQVSVKFTKGFEAAFNIYVENENNAVDTE